MTGVISAPPLKFDNLTLGYDRHPAVHHLDGTVPGGALLAVVGPNGAGKSTLLKGIVGVLKPLEGRIASTANRRDIAYLPQAGDIDRSFPITVVDLVAGGAWRKTGLFGGFARADLDKVSEALHAVGLAGLEQRQIGALSGGQLQRALFARLMLQDASIILLDEPFTAIDARTTADLLALIARWHGEKRTVIAVLHDLDLVRRHFDEALLLARESVAWGPVGESLSNDNLSLARKIIESAPAHAAICERAA